MFLTIFPVIQVTSQYSLSIKTPNLGISSRLTILYVCVEQKLRIFWAVS